MPQAVLQPSVGAALLVGAKTQETPRKAAGQNLRLTPNRRDYGDIPPKMQVSAPAGLEPEQVNGSLIMGYDEPAGRPPADP